MADVAGSDVTIATLRGAPGRQRRSPTDASKMFGSGLQGRAMAATRQHLEETPWAYFAAVDAKDLGGSLSFFAKDATFTIQSAGVTFRGLDEIAGMFRGFFADYQTISHRITNIVVDERNNKTATEQSCPHVKVDGLPDTLTTCNFFTFTDEGKFQRVIIWIDGSNPLVGER